MYCWRCSALAHFYPCRSKQVFSRTGDPEDDPLQKIPRFDSDGVSCSLLDAHYDRLVTETGETEQ